MANELRRFPRYSLTAVVEIVDLNTGMRIIAQTADLSLVGCYVDTLNPLPPGTHVKVSIMHENETFTGGGRWFIPERIWEWASNS
jgi:PilZ domain